jgi:hypothetical protein
MNSIEETTGKPYREWTDKLDLIRTKLNELRKKKLPDNIFTYVYPYWNAYKEIQSNYIKKSQKSTEPKYKKSNQSIK